VYKVKSRPHTSIVGLLRTDDPAVTCWTGQHALYVATALIGLCLFVPAALYIKPRLQDVSPQLQIKFSPYFLLWLMTAQLLLAGVTTFFSSAEYLYGHVITVFLIAVALGVYTYVTRRDLCTYPGLVTWRLLGSVLVAWTAFCALLAKASPHSLVIFALWLVLFLGAIVFVILVRAGLINTPAVALARITRSLHPKARLPELEAERRHTARTGEGAGSQSAAGSSHLMFCCGCYCELVW